MEPHSPTNYLISLEKKVALSLYAFATGSDYSEISLRFGVSRTSVCKFTKKFAEAVLEKLGPYLLAMPKNEEEYREIRSNFQRVSDLPTCVGLLGACEIIISPTLDESEIYANKSGSFTVIFQALVDDKMLFRKVQIEPKRPTMLLTSPNEITKLGARQIKDDCSPCFFPCFITGPSDYYTPDYYTQPWIMQPYENPQVPHQFNFNEAIDKLQSIKREAFLRLFTRWKILQRKTDLEPRTMIIIASTCCALHNLLEECEEHYDQRWSEGVDMSNFDQLRHFQESPVKTSESTKMEAKRIRDRIANAIYDNMSLVSKT